MIVAGDVIRTQHFIEKYICPSLLLNEHEGTQGRYVFRY